VERAIRNVFTEGTFRTGDLGGKASTDQFVDAVIAQM
jgi:isocitrate/isopropylmalate dehydrogenase